MPLNILLNKLNQQFSSSAVQVHLNGSELVMQVARDQLLNVCYQLRDGDSFQFNQLIDVCGVDYSTYGQSEWIGDAASSRGFSRGTHPGDQRHRIDTESFSRFAVVYHLLSTVHNTRLRIRVHLDSDQPLVDTLTNIWSSANWFEREVFDLFGIVFDGHPDLRRILTDYGFIGHPFRKDFPLSGHVEVRYDPVQKRVVYEPVEIEPRVLVPKVIRHDHRYVHEPESD